MDRVRAFVENPQRTRERGMRLAIIGVVLGLAAAFGLTRYLSSMLFQVKAWDPLVFVAVPVVLTLVSLVAVWFPAQRATVIDPVEALRVE